MMIKNHQRELADGHPKSCLSERFSSTAGLKGRMKRFSSRLLPRASPGNRDVEVRLITGMLRLFLLMILSNHIEGMIWLIILTIQPLFDDST